MLCAHEFTSQLAGILFFCLVLLAAWCGPVRAGRVIVIDKSTAILSVLQDGHEIVRCPASFGLDPISDKVRAHDLATPEGCYSISAVVQGARFHRSLGLSYPNLVDAQHGLAAGLLSRRQYRQMAAAIREEVPGLCGTPLGCGIAIHGGGVVREGVRDWTEGCVAVDNADVDRLAQLCRRDDPVLIFSSQGSLYRLLRPFAAVQDADSDGLPACPDGVCRYEVRLALASGMLHGLIREGGTQGISLQIAVYAPNATAPVLELLDRNADGHLSYLDQVSGPLTSGKTPDGVQTGLRRAVADALRSGALPLAADR